MTISRSVCRLRCILCKRGLLRKYNVYNVIVDKYGTASELVPYSCITGYFYKKSNRYRTEIIDIPGEISADTRCQYYLIAFSCNCKSNDLVDINGQFYKITVIDNTCGYYVLSLEANYGYKI